MLPLCMTTRLTIILGHNKTILDISFDETVSNLRVYIKSLFRDQLKGKKFDIRTRLIGGLKLDKNMKVKDIMMMDSNSYVSPDPDPNDPSRLVLFIGIIGNKKEGCTVS